MNTYIGHDARNGAAQLKASKVSDLSVRNDIQGLRAIAVLAVILFHANKDWLPGGFIGVDIFLVISGFLITSIILRQQEGNRFNFVDFYLSRFRRIAPAYLVLLAVVAAVMAVFLVPDDFRFFKKSLNSALYFSSNNHFADFGDYFAPSAHELPLLHTWSLAVEMQFYLLLPLVLLMPRRLNRFLLPGIALALTAYVGYQLNDNANRQAVYFSLLARIPEFLVGATLALWKPAGFSSPRLVPALALAGLLLVLTSVSLIDESRGFPGWIALLPCLGAVMMMAARRGPVTVLLSAAPMVWIGGLSYSLYLWHWPVLAAIRYYTGQYELTPEHLALFAVLTLLLSYLSYRWIEQPFRSAPNRHTAWLRIAAILALAAPLIALSSELNRGLVESLPVEQTQYAVDAEICHGKLVGDCIHGDRDGKQPLLVLGDSHAAQLNLFFDAVGKTDKLAARIISGSSCVTIPGFDVERLPDWAQAACRAQIQAAAPYLEQAPKIVIAAMWQYQTQSTAFLQAFEKFLQGADARGQKVLVMAQLPMFDSNMQRMTRFDQLGLPVSRKMNDQWQAANQLVAQIVAKHPSASFLDLSADPLFEEAPYADGTLIYYDNHHLNEIGARRYAEIAAPYFTDF
ncbi:acyltransferase family protein [Pseudomonas sp. JS3066]|uniref:acyltransferase family protein n=1 Tax=Pseudomonas sp. JS3066 TaxID=3090665 RepID=UPI002E7B0145|nr:acyltransferase family protein [Pseudomonas sp. JS3066]WVK92112.1 acyltransferase family protein [Pseudomonas sp. JS3066]